MPEAVKPESEVTLRDVGPVLEVTLPGGRRAHLRLSKVDCPVLLKAVIGWVTDVLDPCELAGRMIERAYTAPLEGASMVETLDEIEQAYDPEAEAEELAAADEKARHRAQDAMFKELERERAAREALGEEARARQAVLDVAEAKRWKIFQSPSRIQRDRERAQRYAREVEWVNRRLCLERDQAIREAVAAVTARITAEYQSACEQNRSTFELREKRR